MSQIKWLPLSLQKTKSMVLEFFQACKKLNPCFWNCLHSEECTGRNKCQKEGSDRNSSPKRPVSCRKQIRK
eukprot:UN13209